MTAKEMTPAEIAVYTIQTELIRCMSKIRVKNCEPAGPMLNVTLTNNDVLSIDLRGDAVQIMRRAGRELYRRHDGKARGGSGK